MVLNRSTEFIGGYIIPELHTELLPAPHIQRTVDGTTVFIMTISSSKNRNTNDLQVALNGRFCIAVVDLNAV